MTDSDGPRPSLSVSLSLSPPPRGGEGRKKRDRPTRPCTVHRAGGGHGDDGLVGRLTTNRASRLLQSLFTHREPTKRKGGVAPSGDGASTHTRWGLARRRTPVVPCRAPLTFAPEATCTRQARWPPCRATKRRASAFDQAPTTAFGSDCQKPSDRHPTDYL